MLKTKWNQALFLDLADNTDDYFSYVVLPVKDWPDILLQRRPVTILRSVVRSRKINSNDEPTCCRTLDSFMVSNRHGDELFGTDEIELNHIPSSITTELLRFNEDTNKMFSPLPNLKHDLEIDNNDIDNPTSLYNSLFLEEEQHFITFP